jgi:hypothetical protein
MRIALKYGLLITAVVIAWILIVRLGMGVGGAGSKANVIAPILFNLTAIVAIFLGMRERKKELGGNLGFKEALKIGMAISLVYGISACLFFMVQFLIAGAGLLLSETGPAAPNVPMWQIAITAYAGLFFGSLFFGLIYSTVIAFFLAKRRGRDYTEII